MNFKLLCDELRRDEGVCRTPYLDTEGIVTVGCGHNCQDIPIPQNWKYPLTDVQIEALFQSDLARTTASLDAKMPWWRALDPVRQRAIANLAFNLGVGKLLLFRKMLAALQAGQWDKAGDEIANSKYASQVGDRAKRIEKLLRTGRDA